MAVLSLTSDLEARRRFTRQVEAEADTEARACYQCGKCSAGCPVSFAMDYQPRQVMRLVQLGLKDRALASSTIWLCASCHTCTTRCPRGVKIAETMDALRQIAWREGYKPREERVAKFHSIFLNSLRKGGRLGEVGLVGSFKLATGDYFSDLDLGRKLFAQGKLKLASHHLHNPQAVARIFERVREKEAQR